MQKEWMVATHNDIAREVGVSQGTVSKVLGNKSDTISISAKTRKAVIDAAKRMGYNRDKVASGLIQLAEDSIAVLVEHIANPLTGVLLNAMEEQLAQTEYQFLFASSNGKSGHLLRMVQSLARRYTTGFMLAPFHDADSIRSVHKYLKKRGIPFVQANSPGEKGVPSVGTDYLAAFKQLTEHLIRLGHTRIALYGAAPEDPSIERRIRGYHAALLEAGLEAAPAHVACVERPDYFRLEAKERLLNEWLASSTPPTAIMTLKDNAALQFMHLLQRRGLRIPDDMAVTGFDDYRQYHPNVLPESYWQLTTVRQNLPEIGRMAVLRLIDGIESENRKTLPMEIIVPATVVIRGSCGAKAAMEEPFDSPAGLIGSCYFDL